MDLIVRAIPTAEMTRAARVDYLTTQGETNGLSLLLPVGDRANLVLVGCLVTVSPTTYAGHAAFSSTAGQVPIDDLDLWLSWDEAHAVTPTVDVQGATIVLAGYAEARTYDLGFRLLESRVPDSSQNLTAKFRGRFATANASGFPVDVRCGFTAFFRRDN